MKKYKVVFIYAPYPNKEFKTLGQAREFSNSQVAMTEIQRKTLFGKWKKVEKPLDIQGFLCYNKGNPLVRW
jgi:hypothetical protein